MDYVHININININRDNCVDMIVSNISFENRVISSNFFINYAIKMKIIIWDVFQTIMHGTITLGEVENIYYFKRK